MKHIQVLVDGKPIYDEQVDSREIAYTNRDGLIVFMAGPGTAAMYLSDLIGKAI